MQSCVIKQTTALSMRSESGFSILNHSVEWDKFVLRILTYPLQHWFNIYIMYLTAFVTTVSLITNKVATQKHAFSWKIDILSV